MLPGRLGCRPMFSILSNTLLSGRALPWPRSSLYSPHPMLLKDKVALITGSGRGIGRAIARLFAEEGACVFLTARTQSELASVAEEISLFGSVAFRTADLTHDADCEQ